MTTKHDLSTDQGETFKLSARYKDPSGTPINLVGHTVTFRRFPNGTGAALSSHVAQVDEQGGIVVSVPDEVTALWERGTYMYRLEHQEPGGDIDFLLKGRFTVRGQQDV